MTTITVTLMVLFCLAYANRGLLTLKRGRKPAHPTGKRVYFNTPKSRVA